MMTALRSTGCTAFGVQFQLAADSDLLLAKMLKCAPLGVQICEVNADDGPHFSLAHAAGAPKCCLSLDDEVLAEGPDLEPILDQLSRDLMLHVANHALDRVFIHAGVVAWRGSALVFPGTSFAGKTTLVAALVRAGATYYSDEYAVLDTNGWVHPYPRPLQMRQPGGLRQQAVHVAELGGTAADMPIPVSNVIFTEYAENGVWSPQTLTPGMAALDMLRHAIPVRRSPARVMATLAKMMETASAVRSSRGEAGEAAVALLAAMSESLCEVAV